MRRSSDLGQRCFLLSKESQIHNNVYLVFIIARIQNGRGYLVGYPDSNFPFPFYFSLFFSFHQSFFFLFLLIK